MYSIEARKYIFKLIRIQHKLRKEGYERNDQLLVEKSISHLKKYLEYYRYNSKEQMQSFIQRNRDHIQRLIPHEKYPGYQKLLNEFINLQNQ